MKGQPYIIVGMHRAGTSLVAKMLSELGLDLGNAEDFVPANHHNPEGYWENEWLIGANEALLSDLGMAWDRTQALPIGWREMPRTRFHLANLTSVLQRVFPDSARWGWKDPRTTLLIPAYNDVLGQLGIDPTFVICVRHPISVAQSLVRRDGTTEGEALGLWLLYTLTALKETAGNRRVLVVYEDALADPVAALRPICRSWDATPEQWEAAVRAARPDLNHGAKPEFRDFHPPLVERTWDLVRGMSQNQIGFADGVYQTAIGELCVEHSAWLALQKLEPSAFGLLSLQFQTGNQRRIAKVGFHARRSWEKVTVDFEATPGSTVLGGFGGLVGSIWVKDATLLSREGLQQKVEFGAGRGAFIDATPEGLVRFMTYSDVDQFSFQVTGMKGPCRLTMEISAELGAAAAADVARRLGQNR